MKQPAPELSLDSVPSLELSELHASYGYQGVRMVDVRSPEEFADDRIPGAVSVPLFSDFERKVVGYLYKHKGKDGAVGWGEAQVVARLEQLTRELVAALALDDLKDTRPRIVCCARGGLRSTAVTAHLRDQGYDTVAMLVEGYRSYRCHVRQVLATAQIPQPVALHGLTGTGKTDVLREIATRYPRRIIDLELYAGHRSSLLGDIGLEPTTQKGFESRLASDLERLEGPWTIAEWEGTRIGNRHLAKPLHRQLVDGAHILFEAPMERRITTLGRDYLADGGQALGERLAMFKGLKGVDDAVVDHWQELLASGNTDQLGRELLENHYDPRYLHSMNQTAMDVTFESHADCRRTADEVLAWVEERYPG